MTILQPGRRRALVLSAGAGVLLVSLTTPALAAQKTARAAAAAGPVVSRSLQAAMPSPTAPHSTSVVPGVTGTAAQQAQPRISGPQRLAQIQAARSAGTARSTVAASGSAAAPAGNVTPGLTSWAGVLHTDWGVSPAQTIYGAQATQSLNPGVTVKPDQTFLPTLDPSGIDCIEMATEYLGGAVQVAAFDWCKGTGTWAKFTAVSASFLDSFATKVSGHYYYSVQDVQTNATTNSWTAYLYDYQDKKWHTYYTSAGTIQLANSGGGWDMGEAYTSYNAKTTEGGYCTQTSGSVWATTGLKYQLTAGGPWTPATAANSSLFSSYPKGSDLGCAGISFALQAANSAFSVTNSSRPAAEIVSVPTKDCIDTANAKFANGTEEDIETCKNGPGQTWAHNADGELTVDSGKFCLTGVDDGTSPGTLVDLQACHNTPSQEWTFSLHATIVGALSGLCVQPSGTAKGSQLELEPCTGAPIQQW